MYYAQNGSNTTENLHSYLVFPLQIYHSVFGLGQHQTSTFLKTYQNKITKVNAVQLMSFSIQYPEPKLEIL